MPSNAEIENFYNRLKAITTGPPKYNYAEFCRIYNHSRSTLNNYLTPESKKLPPGDIIFDLCKWLNISADYLFFDKRGLLNDDADEKLISILSSMNTPQKYEAAGILRMLNFGRDNFIENGKRK